MEELALRVGLSVKTISNFERTGRWTLETFARILEALNALPDLEGVLVTQLRSIGDMRRKDAAGSRQRAYTRTRKAAP